MKNWIRLYFQEVLSNNRLELLPKLIFFKNLWYYLAGWTALALQFWHRKSIDYDFFIHKDIDTEKLFNEVLSEFKWYNIKKTYEENNTLYIEINDIKFSFMTYNYDLVENIIETEYLNIANFIDIWAMKLWAIQKRATNKDYVDLYYILKRVSLKNLLIYFENKYWNIINKNILLKSIIYFDDITLEDLFINEKISFEDIQESLVKIVKQTRL